MDKRLSGRFAVLLGCLVVLYAIQGRGDRAVESVKQDVNPDAKVLEDFKSRVNAYVELRNDLRKQAPPLKETKDAGEIQAAQDALAEKIRAARKDAKPGDILTPDVRRVFRRLMSPEMKGREGADAKQSMKEDAPAPKSVPLKVNAKYPEKAPLPTVPPNLLAALPKLPEDIEYRFIDKDLILLDVRANLIVDYMQNAIR